MAMVLDGVRSVRIASHSRVVMIMMSLLGGEGVALGALVVFRGVVSSCSSMEQTVVVMLAVHPAMCWES